MWSIAPRCQHVADMSSVISTDDDAGDGEANLQTFCKECGAIMTALVSARMFSCPDEE